MANSQAPATSLTGLSASDVAARVAAGQVNVTDDRSSRSIGSILRANTLTLFNLILFIALVLVLSTGRWADAAFGGVIIINIFIGVVTEVRAKRTLDRLAILNAAHAVVLRDGAVQHIAIADVVLDDVAQVATGDQIPADGELVAISGLEVDESLLTGESRPVRKAVGDEVLSGSSVVAGTGTYRVTRVGADGYANKLTAAAKQYSTVHSELQGGINTILRYVSIAIVPIALLLAWSQLRSTGGWATAWEGGHWKDAVVAAVAGVVGMIPEGLVLLTSLNFALAAVILARQQVLIQELPAVEIMARVDVLCLDKTGTLTDGTIALTTLVDLQVDGRAAPGATAASGAREALAALAAADGGNATSQALSSGLAEVTPVPVTAAVPFSSARKWSAIETAQGAWVLGAPEILLAERTDEAAANALAQVAQGASTGARVLLLASVPAGLPDVDAPLPADLVPVTVAVLGENVRPDAADTLRFFREQGVAAKVISGDNPQTVAAIASELGLLGDGVAVEGYDARELPEDLDELAAVLDDHHVFGRVVPEQKRAIVHALQRRGHVVAMTGDGVNDSLALKDADLGIAMGNGAPATKAVARIVLLDGRFATLPGVLGQGRRVMANMERVSTLFLTKTAYSFFLALATVALTFSLGAWEYPFLPRHLTLAGALTIGIPAFFLSLPPNNRRYVPGFLRRVLSFALPVGLVLGVAVLASFAVLRGSGTVPAETVNVARTATTAVLIGVGFWVVGLLARPLQAWKVGLIALLAAAAVGAYTIPWVHTFFLLEPLTAGEWLTVAIVVPVAWVVIGALHLIIGRANDRALAAAREG